MQNMDENGNLTQDKERLPTIQVNRSSEQTWLNSLGEMYQQHLENPTHAGIANAYMAEKKAFNSAFEALSPPPEPQTVEDMDYMADLVLKHEAATRYADQNPSDLNARKYAQVLLAQKMANIPGESSAQSESGYEVVGGGSPHIEVVGGGDPVPVEIVK